MWEEADLRFYLAGPTDLACEIRNPAEMLGYWQHSTGEWTGGTVSPPVIPQGRDA